MNKLKEIKIRNGRPSDHEKVVSVMPEWWGGRNLSSSVLKIFFIHFSNTTYIAEINGELVGFLVGFMSQTEANVGYIHFAGVHPPGGHPKSPTCGHLKIPHPPVDFSA